MVALSLMLATLVSEDLATIAGGLLLREGRIGAAAAILSVSLGIFAGDLGLWGAGRLARRVSGRIPALARLLARLPIEQSRQALARRAPVVILASRFVPGTRLPLYVSAGFLQLPFRTFAVWTAMAVLLWAPLLVLVSAGIGGAALDPIQQATGSQWAGRIVVALCALLAAGGLRWLAGALGRAPVRARLERWARWEFWPMWLFYAPVAIWVAVLALRYRGPGTIAAANPGIPDGGTVGESKYRILTRLPADVTVPSALVAPGELAERVRAALAVVRDSGWGLPIVAKPDVGQRGAGVRLVRSEAELTAYLAAQRGAVLLQPYHPGPHEAGVFYYRFPGEARGRILSITDKRFPVVVGDGRSSLAALIAAHPRYRLQERLFLARHHAVRDRVIPAGERFQLALAGNHAQGTMFRDGSHLWTPALERRIDDIAQSYDGFYVGRFDIRYGDEDDFRQGVGLAIVELNGATAESTDIYDPSRSLVSAYRRLFEQWSIVFAIGSANRAAGAPASSLRRLVELVRVHRSSSVAFEISD